jgi:hypothetical protein
MCIRKKWNKQKDKLSNFKDKVTYENKIKYNLFIYFISKIIHLNNYFIKLIHINLRKKITCYNIIRGLQNNK